MEIGIEQARAKLGDLVNRVTYGRETVYLTRYGRRVAAIVPAEEPTMDTRYTIEVDATPGAVQACASEVLHRQLGISQAGRLGVEVILTDKGDAERLVARLQESGYRMICEPDL